MILLIALAALCNHGIGVYRVFFVFYFLLLGATFLSLLIGLIILRTGRYAADFGYEQGLLNRSVGGYIETEHEFWRVYIYFSFGFFIFELLYAIIMFKAYYYDKARNEEKRHVRGQQQSSGQLPAHFSFSMSGQPPTNPYSNADAPPHYSESKEYYAPTGHNASLPSGGNYTPLKTITDV
uniref:Uncharacterized protein n=1 Tax=Ditylenchus dipsaci TaxID=166011 RepID=A0A915CVX4_9BILA